MPKDTSLRSILVLGSGPIVIGQACEFDYSGTQAVKALSQEGYRVILVNSNPATIMTDPDLLTEADATYIEPLTLESLRRVIDRERPDAILPTVGGQTAINLALELADAGVLERYGVRLLGANPDALRLAEDRLQFKDAMIEIGLDVPRSRLVSSKAEALEAAEEFGFPLVVRASFTLGGMGSGAARDHDEFLRVVERGLELSPVHQVLVEESVHGWYEYELEVMRDQADQAVVICSIENFDPMGVHTGDSITVAPAMTLTDRELQTMRDQAFQVIRRVGVETGGSNIQFALHPTTRRITVIEMNPRVSRSSALASKATGFPIAKIAARLAVGYRLDEIANDITQKTPACFEPALDYVVVKIPRWNFEKFPGAVNELGTQMRSVGEVMAIGRTFQEALQKGMRSLELSTSRGAREVQERLASLDGNALEQKLRIPDPERMYSLREAFRRGYSVDTVSEISSIGPWFLQELAEIVHAERAIDDAKPDVETIPAAEWRRLKRMGFSDARLAKLLSCDPVEVRRARRAQGVAPVFHRVDTCAGEFQSFTPYLYSTYESRCEAEPTDQRKVLVLGGGPIRIGQGIEFDYCACHAAFALHEMGLESILLNCNPETVSTDYDTADRLYFEPVTFEDVMNVVEKEWPEGVIVQFGGQTPLNLAHALEKAGVRILGTSVRSIDLAEDRYRFAALLESLDIPRPAMGTALSVEEACVRAKEIGYPVMVRPSYVLGGRAMQVVYDEASLEGFAQTALELSQGHPLFLDRFLEDAFELDVDAVSDGEDVFVAGIQQHIEEAGIHSGDSACVLPPYKVSRADQQTLADYTVRLARALEVVGLLNVQFAIKDGTISVIEANPRASRTIPYVSKAIGLPLARIATRVILGGKLDEILPREVLAPREDKRPAPQGTAVVAEHAPGAGQPGTLPLLAYERYLPNRVIVKMPVFSSNRFPEVDTLLGPEMRSTGEVLGIGRTFGEAYLKAALGAGIRVPHEGNAFLSVHDNDKEELFPIARDLARLGFHLLATSGTAHFLAERGLDVETVFKVNEGSPHVADLIADGQVDLVINTPLGRESHFDEAAIRRAALAFGVPCVTTLSGSRAVVDAIRTLREGSWIVESVQSLTSRRSRPDAPSARAWV